MRILAQYKYFIYYYIIIINVIIVNANLHDSKYSVLQQIKDPAVSGLYEAIVVHADHSAVAFFKKCGFTDDLILNSKWA